MKTIEIITIEDIKTAIREVLAEQQQQTKEHDEIIHGLKGLKVFGIGVTTGWKMVKSGKIPSYRIGEGQKKLFFKRSEVEAVLKQFKKPGQ